MLLYRKGCIVEIENDQSFFTNLGIEMLKFNLIGRAKLPTISQKNYE